MNLSSCVHQFFDQYLARIKGSTKRTIKTYREVFTLFLPFAADYNKITISDLTLDHLSIEVILSFLDYLESQRKNSIRTRNHRLAAIKSFAKMIRFLYPEKREIAERILYLPQKRTQKKLIGFLYMEEVIAAYKAVDLKKANGFRDYTILHLLFDSGIRATELAMLQLDDFNPRQKTLGILGKGNKFRLIEIEQKTTDLIKVYISKYRIKPKSIYQDRLFVNKNGRGFTRHGIYRICKKYLSMALSPKRLKAINSVHSFRHACAVNMIAQGKSISDVKNRLGHESIESTRVYLHMDLRKKLEVQRKYLEYLQSIKTHDPKIDELIDWENKKETLAWLDSL